MEDRIEEKTEEDLDSSQDKKQVDKIEAIVNKILLGLIAVTIVLAGIWLGLSAENRFGVAIKQNIFKSQDITQDTTTDKLPVNDNVIVYQSKKAELLGGIFTYPGSKVESRKQDVDKINIAMNSSDTAETVVKYYRDLVAVNSWSTVRVGGDTGEIKITQSDFSALVKVGIDGEFTTITADIDFPDPETMTSTFNTPAKTEQVSPTPPSDDETEAEGYILPFSGTRLVNTDDLKSLSPWELKVARNEIYARYGRSFIHKDLSCFFSKQSWYVIDPDYSDNSLSDIDKSNISTILSYEKSVNSPLLAKDSGCKE